jgi:hypothetical protein
MLDDLVAALDDNPMVLLREWRKPVPACAAPFRTGTDSPPESWTVAVTTTSSTSATPTYGLAWTGDITLVADGAVSNALIADARLNAFHLVLLGGKCRGVVAP